MNLQNILSPEFIKMNLKAGDKNEAFKELVNHYCKMDNSSSYDQILDAVVKREAKMSTGIHKGIAVPHGRTEAVEKICGVVGISEKGVQYDSLDGEPVHIIFMIVAPSDDSDNFLWMLKHLAQLIEIPQFKTELLSQKDPQSAFNVICKFEQTLSGK